MLCFHYVLLGLKTHNTVKAYHAKFPKGNNPFSIFGTVNYHFKDVKMKKANSIEPGQIAQMCRLAWLYTGGKG